jgi:molybdopterin synthase catalytic subunit
MIRVQQEDFDAAEALERLREQSAGQAGALVSFIGLVRDLNAGERIDQLTLEHYPGMTEKALLAIEQEARRRWTLAEVIIIHRVGDLRVNDRIVLVAASSPHRREAFQACEYMIDALKTNAPFWKKEHTPRGARWVTTNNP